VQVTNGTATNRALCKKLFERENNPQVLPEMSKALHATYLNR